MARGVFARFWMQANILLPPLIARGLVLPMAPTLLPGRSAVRVPATRGSGNAQASEGNQTGPARYPARLLSSRQQLERNVRLVQEPQPRTRKQLGRRGRAAVAGLCASDGRRMTIVGVVSYYAV